MPVKADANIAAEAERLAQAAAEAIEKANQARAKAEEAARRAEERRQAAILELRRRQLDEYDPARLEAEERAAHKRFAEAVLSERSPVLAFIESQVAANLRYTAAVEARQNQAMLHPDEPPVPIGGPSDVLLADAVQQVIKREVANQLEDWREVRQAELDQAGR
jgi:hypothetical protein